MKSTKFSLSALVCILMIFFFLQVAVADDYGSADHPTINPDNYCTCDPGAASHVDFSYEWLGQTVDAETDCYDDNDSDGIKRIYSSANTDLCGDTVAYENWLVEYSIASVIVEICLFDKDDARYSNDNVFFAGWWDANHDGDWDDVFNWNACGGGDYSAGEDLEWIRATKVDASNVAEGSCEVVEDNCFEPDISEWANDCQHYRLTFRTPCNVPTGYDFFLRFRLGYETCPAGACGSEDFGEVEDVSGQQTPQAIELSSFEAIAQSDRVLISWETETEADNAGFRVWSATSETGSYEIISALIPAEGNEFTGASYTMEDTSVSQGNTYWYKLEDIDIHGSSTFHGPVNATVENEFFGCGVARSGGTLLVFLLLALITLIAWSRKKPTYKKPKVHTTNSDEVIKEIGPAQTCSPSPTCPTAQ